MFKRFLQHQQGSVLLITGVMILVLFAAMGMSIDLGRQQLVRLKLQQATDAAALAAALLPREASIADRERVAQRYYNLNFPDTYLGVPRPTPTINAAGPIDVQATTEIATRFMGNVGLRDMNASGHSVVALDGQTPTNYDVLLVMDNSNSMAETITGSAASFLNVPNNEMSAARAKAISDCRLYYQTTGIPEPLRSIYLNACDHGRDTDGTSNAIDPNNPIIYYGLQGNSRLNALRASALSLVQQILSSSPNSKVGLIRFAGDVDFTDGFLNLTQNQQQLEQFINRMSAVNGTNSLAAMNKAVDLASDFNNTHARAVVFLTDGQNTQADILRYVPTATPVPLSDGTPGACNGNRAYHCQYATDRSLPLCTQLKNDGVLIYTVAYGSDVNGGTQSAGAESFLRNCATLDNDTYFKRAANATELNQVFSEILTQLGKVRIVQ